MRAILVFFGVFFDFFFFLFSFSFSFLFFLFPLFPGLQVEKIMQKIDCNNDGSISVYEWTEQGKAIGMLDPLVSCGPGGGKGKGKKGKKISTLPHTFTSTYTSDKILGKLFYFFFYFILLL